jgi:hypothetical protein
MPKTQKQPTSVPPFDPKQKTKSARVLDLMEREMGATLAELIEATGWQAHTIRAALTGLRKKGHAIERRKRDGLTASRPISCAEASLTGSRNVPTGNCHGTSRAYWPPVAGQRPRLPLAPG